MPVWNFEELCARKDEFCIVVGSSRYWQSICQQLLVAGFGYESIYCPIAFRHYIMGDLSENQYFDFFEPRQREILVDAGSYDGETTIKFAKWAADGFIKSYIFEANPDNENIIRRNLTAEKIANYELLMKGTWNRVERVQFNNIAGAGSMVSANGTIMTEMTSIDVALAGAEVTFIKMDVEGSEAQTIMGAEKTIMMHKPRLAVSLYHMPWDFIELPNLILNIESNYKFSIRHYTSCELETVLYAWQD